MKQVQHKSRWKIILVAVLFAARLAAPPVARAALSDEVFEYEIVGSTVSVTGCVEYPCPTELEIPATFGAYAVTSVGNYAFFLDGLTSVRIPDSVTTIGDGAFYGNDLTSVTIGNSVTIIGEAAFAGNDLTTVTIPDSVTTISEDAFFSNALTEVTIPASVTTIGAWAFSFNALSSVTFLGNAPSDGGSVFSYNSGLTSILRPVDATGWGAFWSDLPVETPIETVDGFAYRVANGVATVVGCDGTCPTNLVIPADLGGYVVRHIGVTAFSSSGLESLTLPGSITSIGDGAFGNNTLTTLELPSAIASIEAYAFYGNNLTSLVIPNSVRFVGEWAFSGNALTTLTIPQSIAAIPVGAFYRNNLESLTIPSSVTTIGADAFAQNSLTSLVIPGSVASIDSEAFAYNNLGSVAIPNSVVSIGYSAFGSNNLSSVTFFGNAPVDGGYVFDGNDNLFRVSRYKGTVGWSGSWSGVAVKTVVANLRAFAAVKPRITGTATSGKRLTAAKGTWSGYPNPTFTYQWYACKSAVTGVRTSAPSNCTKIKGATRSTFTLTRTQRGKYVTVLVSGKSARTSATSWLAKSTAKVR
jgi:hypothetical protein